MTRQVDAAIDGRLRFYTDQTLPASGNNGEIFPIESRDAIREVCRTETADANGTS